MTSSGFHWTASKKSMVMAINDSKVRLAFVTEEFSFAMRKRLYDKEDQGRSGWDDPEAYPDEDLQLDIEEAFERYLDGRTDELNVANYLMFAWERKNDKK